MANAVPGISTLGVRVGWMSGDANTVPTSGSCTWLTRINATGEIALDTNTIDASALEDYVDKTIAGRASTGGTYSITVNVTPETMTEWAAGFSCRLRNSSRSLQRSRTACLPSRFNALSSTTPDKRRRLMLRSKTD